MRMILVALVLVASVMGAAAHTALAGPVASPVQKVADRAAGRPVTLQCDSAESVRGEVGWALAYVVLDGSSVIHLGPTVCDWLKAPKSPTYGEALIVVIHEALHLRYASTDEALTQARAMAAFPGLVRWAFPRANQRVLAWGAARIDAMLPPEYRGG